MLTKLKSPFKFLRGYNSQDKSSTYASSKKGLMVLVGLQTLVQVSEGNSKSNVVIKSAMRKAHHHHHRPSIESCYLKTCYLCNKNLSLDKDIYMYRGDQGFCSVECRNRQIVLDEMRELESSTKKMRKSYNRYDCSSAGRHETRSVLEELRRRHKPIAHDHQKHWAIVS